MSSLGNERVTLPGVQRVDVTVGVVECAVPQMFSELEGHFPLRQSHLLPVPYVHLTAKVKDQHLDKNQYINYIRNYNRTAIVLLLLKNFLQTLYTLLPIN